MSDRGMTFKKLIGVSLLLAGAGRRGGASASASTSPAWTAPSRPATTSSPTRTATWLKTTEIPADRGAYGAGAIVAELTNERTAELIQQAAGRERAGGLRARGRSATTTRASWTRRRSRPRACGRCSPPSTASPPSGTSATLSRVLGGTLRADVDALNATNFYTDNLFGLWVAQDLDDPTRYVPFLLQGGLDMPDRDYYLDPSPRMAEIRTRVPGAHRARARRSAGDRGRRRAGRAHLRPRAAHRRGARDAARTPRTSEGQQPLDAAAIRHRARPGSTGTAFFAARRARRPDRVRGLAAERGRPGISALVASQPLETWKDYLTFHAIEHSRGRPARARSARSASRSTARCSAGTPQRARPLEARGGRDRTTRSGEAVGQLYVERYFPPAAKARARGDGEEHHRRLRRAASTRWTGWRPRPRPRPRRSSPSLKVGVGYPDTWRDYSGLEIVARRRVRQRRSAPSCSSTGATSRKLGQPVDRGEWVMTPQTVNAVNLPVHERDELPGRDPAAAVLRSRAAAWPWTTAPSAPSSATRSATASTTRARCSTPTGTPAELVDGRGPGALPRPRRAKLVKQYDAYRPFPDLAVNGKLTLSENIADVAGPGRGLRRLPAVARRQAGAGGGRAHRRPAVLHRASPRAGGGSRASRRCASRSSATATRPTSTAPTPCATSTRGTTAFDVKPGQALYLAPADRVRVW